MSSVLCLIVFAKRRDNLQDGKSDTKKQFKLVLINQRLGSEIQSLCFA